MLILPQPRIARPGYIYVIRCQQYFKIGQTEKPKDRLSSVQINNPFPVKLVLTLWTEDMDATEDQLHSRFSAYHERGEWFLLPIDAVVWLMSLHAVPEPKTPIPSVPDLPSIDEQIKELRLQGYNKAQIIKAIWNLSKGGGSAYRQASAIYDSLITLP